MSLSNVPIIKQKITIIFIQVKAIFLLSDGFSNFTIILIGFLWICIFIFHSFAIIKIYKTACQLIWNGLFFLLCIGNIILTRLDYSLALRQLLWLFIAVLLTLFLPLIIKLLPKLEKLEYLYLSFGILLLLSTFIIGTEEFGSIRWIRIGGFGFSPAEIVGFTYILYIATAFRKKINFIKTIFPTAMAFFHVVILVALRNLGGALIFFVAYIIIMYVSTGNKFLLLSSIFSFSIGSFFAYRIFNHVAIRVSVWLNPWYNAFGIGFQIVQSLFAIGTWGIWGSGLGLGLPSHVPVVARDLTFAAITEEFGIIFAMGIIGVYIMIFYRGVHIALRCRRRYYSLLSVGFTSVLAFQTFLIIGGTINLIPLTGVTLPFISYGGSSLLISIIMISMLQWIFINNENL
ncbi:MAG: FtsW/RodA/SpoVE family cell cycle protein [Defluviitaleaceae bacterium]|nr:FtsW/RodA/SpoVE family cell cycle protein [Defluviitaleaceae bacterium]